MKKTLLLSAFLLASIAASQAAVIIDTTSLTPVTQATFATGTANNLSTGVAWTFTTGLLGAEPVLQSIGVEGPQTGAIANVLTLEIWSNPANSSATLDVANALRLATSTNSLALSSNNVVGVFNFAPLTLTDNTVYSVHVVGTTPRIGLVGTTSTDVLPNSRLFQDGSFVFGGTAPNGIDASFNVVTTIPEPSAALLGGLGMLLLLRRRR